MSVSQNLFVGPYAEWAVPLKKDRPIPDAAGGDWSRDGLALNLGADLGEIPEEKRGRARFRGFLSIPIALLRPPSSARNSTFCSKAAAVAFAEPVQRRAIRPASAT